MATDTSNGNGEKPATGFAGVLQRLDRYIERYGLPTVFCLLLAYYGNKYADRMVTKHEQFIDRSIENNTTITNSVEEMARHDGLQNFKIDEIHSDVRDIHRQTVPHPPAPRQALSSTPKASGTK